MNIQQFIEQDPRVIELKQQYNKLLVTKNQLIMDISHVEADIIKLSGAYEVVTKEIIGTLQTKGVVPTPPSVEGPEPVEPVETPIAEENEDDGFAEVKEEEVNVTEIPPSAENDRPIKEE